MITIISFGYGHEDLAPPKAHITFDLRELFRDPHVDPAMRELTGLDDKVVTSVFRQPEFLRFVSGAAELVELMSDQFGDVTVAFGCVGGRHRSVVAARAVHDRLRGLETSLTHRDVERPVIKR